MGILSYGAALGRRRKIRIFQNNNRHDAKDRPLHLAPWRFTLSDL
jgi:hypothetical protein